MSIFTLIPGGLERFLAVSPFELAAYLRSKNWIWRDGDEVRSFWTAKDKRGEDVELLLPAAPTFKDYAARVFEALTTLEAVETRPLLSVLGDIEHFSSDIIRVRVSGRGSQEGDINLEAGVKLFEQSRELMYAAACSAIKSQRVHPNRKPEEATRYIKKVRLGQTEVGSFIVRVISRVPPSLEIQQELLPGVAPEQPKEPFERQVTETLSRSLGALAKAVDAGSALSSSLPFDVIVSQGVSANLCEALAGMEDEDQKVSVGLTWAGTRRIKEGYPSEFSFGPRSLSVIGETARLIRATTPEPDFEVEGYVVKLAKTPKARRGTVGVFVTIDGHPRVISIKLEEFEYRQAVQAHKDKRIVSCSGELVREGHGLTLKNYRNFAVEEAPDE